MANGRLDVDQIGNSNGLIGNGVNPGFKNRIINGAMMIDQRNAGASVTQTASNLYTLDRWFVYGDQASKFTVQQNAASATPPAGFSKYLGVTSSSAYVVGAAEQFRLEHDVEGQNVADLAWGTADAKTVALSFWVRSSLTGTFGGSLRNSAANRSYPFTYTISAANTWELKTVIVTGDTSGTWLTTSGIGIRIAFGLGVGATLSGTAGSWAGANYASATGATSVVGTNAATWYITGVQLEVAPLSTSFDYRSFGDELVLCQRYYEKSFIYTTAPATNVGSDTGEHNVTSGTSAGVNGRYPIRFAVVKRAAPSCATYNTSAANVQIRNADRSSDFSSTNVTCVGTGGFTAYGTAPAATVYQDDTRFHWTADAEL